MRLRPFVLLLLLPLLSACGKDETRTAFALGTGDVRWAAFPVDIQVDASLLADPDSANDLDDAIDFWENKAGRPLFKVTGAWDASRPAYQGDAANPDKIFANVILFQGPWHDAAKVAGKTHVHSQGNHIENAVILLNPDTNVCTGSCWGASSFVSRRKLLAHELGHFIGFGHTDDAGDIMYPEILSGGSMTDLKVDETLLVKLTN